MNTIGTQTIETERLILRRVCMEDAADIHEWSSDPEVTLFMPWPRHESMEETKRILTKWVGYYESAGTYHWGIVVKGNALTGKKDPKADGSRKMGAAEELFSEGDRLIGTISVVSRDERIRSYEIGYCMNRNYWGRGLMPEALSAVIRYLFDGEKDLLRITACHDVRNPKSGRVMQKAGMRFEGIRRDSSINTHGLHDTAYYAILRSDVLTAKHYEDLFLDIHPGFFERDYVKRVPENEAASEMLLRLQEFDETSYCKDFDQAGGSKDYNQASCCKELEGNVTLSSENSVPDGVGEDTRSGKVTFGYYNGDFDELLKAVEQVIPHWVPLFSKNSRVYCGFVDGKIASFCMIEDFGEHVIDGMTWHIGGPGCVGTVPAYRDRGIGLTMVRNVTKILRDEFYDYGYIHYTYETGWYSKLGYRTVVKWNGKGFVKDEEEG